MAEQIPDQQGRLLVINGVPSGPGVEIVVAQPVRVRWRVLGVYATYQASLIVASRLPRLVVTMGGLVVFSAPVRRPFTAGTLMTMVWLPVFADIGQTEFDQEFGVLLPFFYLNNQAVIATVTVNMDAGDQYTAFNVFVEEWMEPLA